MGVGRWKEYMEYMLGNFPNTTFEVHITEDASDETDRLKSPRIEIRPVKGLAWAWLLRILKVAFLRSRPLIVFTGSRYRHMMRLIRTGCILSDPLPATTINHLVQALRFEQLPAGAVRATNFEP